MADNKSSCMIMRVDGIDYAVYYQTWPVKGWVCEYELPDGSRDTRGIFKTKTAAIEAANNN